MGRTKGSFGAVLRQQVKTAPSFMRETTEGSLRGLRVSIVAATPRRTGRLQRSMKKTKAKRRTDGIPGWEGEVYSTLHYAWVVNQGRRKREVFAKPGNYFSIGGEKRTHYTQSAMLGRHMFERGAFVFSTSGGPLEAYMALRFEGWVHESILKTGQGG